jgi:acetate kinase
MPKTDTILVINAGSSSIKFSLYPAAAESAPLGGGSIEGIGIAPRFRAKVGAESFAENWTEGRDLDHAHFYGFLLDWLAETQPGIAVVAAGHRVVHGGTAFAAPVLVDDEVLEALEQLVPLAPLHQPHNLAAIRALRRRAASIPQVACFDTAFHAFTLDETVRKKDFFFRVVRLGYHTLANVAVLIQTPIHQLGKLPVFGGMGSVIIVEFDQEIGEVGLMFATDTFD